MSFQGSFFFFFLFFPFKTPFFFLFAPEGEKKKKKLIKQSPNAEHLALSLWLLIVALAPTGWGLSLRRSGEERSWRWPTLGVPSTLSVPKLLAPSLSLCSLPPCPSPPYLSLVPSPTPSGPIRA